MTSIVPAPGIVSFARGVPGPDLLPLAELERCAADAIRRDGHAALNYGGPGGYGPLREWLADRHAVAPERVVATPGSMLGLNLLLELLHREGRAVLAEEPTYDRALRAMRSRGPLRTVPRTASGLDLDVLASAVREGAGALYVLPTFHNPTGATLTLAQRHALVDLAVERALLVVEDDPYGLLRFEGERLPSLHELLCERGAGELAVYVSSFSKSVAPGLRVGYAVVPEALAAPLERLALDTYVSPPVLPQAQLHAFLEQGLLDPHLARVRGRLRERRDALLAGLEEAAPGLRPTRPEGGYFLWLPLPEPLAADAVLEQAELEGVTFVPGAAFHAGAAAPAAIRLSFSYPPPEELRAGGARLGSVLRRLLASR